MDKYLEEKLVKAVIENKEEETKLIKLKRVLYIIGIVAFIICIFLSFFNSCAGRPYY